MRFVFVHGGFHAAWCWDQTTTELADLGHEGIAVDLPGHGARTDEESTLANRRDAIVAELTSGDVLVGIRAAGSTRRWPPTPRRIVSATSSTRRGVAPRRRDVSRRDAGLRRRRVRRRRRRDVGVLEVRR